MSRRCCGFGGRFSLVCRLDRIVLRMLFIGGRFAAAPSDIPSSAPDKTCCVVPFVVSALRFISA